MLPPAGSTTLHRACTHDIDVRVWKCVIKLEDKDLLAKLASGDMRESTTPNALQISTIEQGLLQTVHTDTGVDTHLNGIVVAKLVMLMEDIRKYTVKNGVLRYTFAMVFWDTFLCSGVT